jgi:hypothetical protein
VKEGTLVSILISGVISVSEKLVLLIALVLKYGAHGSIVG